MVFDRRRTAAVGSLCTLAVVLQAGCTARIGDAAGDPSATRQGGATTAGTAGTTTGGALDCGSPHAPALHARWLSPSQYNNTLVDLVKVEGNPSKDFGGGVDAQLDDLSVERRANAAASVAHQATLSVAQWSPCLPTQIAPSTCEQQIIDWMGARAYRRPLAASERMELEALFDAGIKEKDFATGLEWFLTGVFQSPDFLYQFAKLAAGEVAGEVRPLSGHELASRLSYFVWDGTPDDRLYAAAAADELDDPTRLRAQLDRMVHDQRFLRGVTGFYGSWLRLGSFHEVARDDAAFTTDVVDALRTSLLMSATQLYAAAAPNIATLFSGQSYYMNGTLRAFYRLGGSATDSAFASTDVPGEERRGVLTHPALMALLARPNQTNPISRGLFVRKSLMCQDMPPPPDGVVIPQLPPISPDLSTRDRLDQHAKAPLCASCHDMIDPPGYALENFDQVGRHRSVEGGKPVDTSGTMTNAGDLMGPFASGDALLARIAQSEDIKECFAQKYFEYAASRSVAPEDQCTVEALKKSFAPSGDLRELVVSIATSDAFRLRLSEGAP